MCTFTSVLLFIRKSTSPIKLLLAYDSKYHRHQDSQTSLLSPYTMIEVHLSAELALLN
jgi:hypothetical protein